VVALLFSNVAYPDSRCSVYFLKGYRSFHNLLKNKKKARYRSNWMHVRDLFYRAYKCNPKGIYAPKSLYYLGRTYEELGKRSYLKKDFLKALNYFDKVVKYFPSHSWCDDAKLYSAKIKLKYLKRPKDAYIDLLYIINVYPKGDKIKEARSLLKKLDEKYLKKVDIRIEKNRNKQNVFKSSARAKVIDIRQWSNKDYARIVAEISKKIIYKKFFLKGSPYSRLVVDLKNAYLPRNLLNRKVRIVNRGVLHAIRYAQHGRDVVRLVIELGTVKDWKLFCLDNPFRVVIDIYGKEENSNVKLVKKSLNKSKGVSASLIEQLGLDIKTIMIDPGHGGKDPGAICGGLKEKDINLRLAKILGRMLQRKGFRVLYTRTKDIFIPLEERTVMANTKGADLFISLHVNAHRDRKVHGIEVYYLNLASSKDAIRVAARENAVSSKKISELQIILTDLMLNSKIKESSVLASKVLYNILKDTKKYRPKNNGIREAPFYVLMGAKMPAILIEIGYITNPKERRRLRSYSYLKQIARGIVEGVLAYRKDIKKFAGL
jgi:N-acetylmuramoyl-L-alanine amidase